jgi:NAD-dependent SIR2 family protein deacetylase
MNHFIDADPGLSPQSPYYREEIEYATCEICGKVFDEQELSRHEDSGEIVCSECGKAITRWAAYEELIIKTVERFEIVKFHEIFSDENERIKKLAELVNLKFWLLNRQSKYDYVQI